LTRAVFCMALLLSACASNGEQQPFMPRSDYPVDAWVKGYAQEDDCLGGEKLAAIKFDLPEYPRRAYKNGRQGWTLVQLDVDAGGQTQNGETDLKTLIESFGDRALGSILTLVGFFMMTPLGMIPGVPIAFAIIVITFAGRPLL